MAEVVNEGAIRRFLEHFSEGTTTRVRVHTAITAANMPCAQHHKPSYSTFSFRTFSRTRPD